MLNGLTREVRWRDIKDEAPQKIGYYLVAHMIPGASGDGPLYHVPSCRAAYWNGTGFMTTESPYYPILTVTHWMPYPELPKEEDMRRVFAEVMGEGV